MFLVPLAPVAAALPSQPSGHSLLPGTVTASNTWNQTLVCPASSKATEPLEPLSSWNASLSIPSLLFMGVPQGSDIVQTFHLAPNGTFSVYDSRGNSYSFTVPIAAVGASYTTLVGNSTAAVEETRVTAGPLILADVTLAFSVYDQSCHPAGVRLVISGTEDWGAASTGVLQLQFTKAPTSVSHDRAYFTRGSADNQSSVSLGFDWSDSSGLGPVFNAAHDALSYNVGSTFRIDPVTFASTSTAWPLRYPFQSGKVFYRDGLWWAFWVDAGATPSEISYVYSSDGIGWSPVQNIPLAGYSVNNNCVTFATDRLNHFWYFYSACNNYYQTVYYRHGTLDPNGTVSWSIPQSTITTVCNYPEVESAAIDHSGNVWLTIRSTTSSMGCSSPSNTLEVWEYSSGSWTTRAAFAETSAHSSSINLLSNGRVSIVAGVEAASGAPTSASPYDLVVYYWNPATKGFNTMSEAAPSWLTYGSTVGSGNVTYIAAPNNGSVVFQACPWDSSCSDIPSLGSSVEMSSIASNNASGLSIEYTTESASSVYELNSLDGGATWSNPAPISVTEDVSQGSFSIDPELVGNMVASAWLSGSSSPYDLRLSLYPTIVPTAAASPDPWSRPGLSPYESYFSEFSDYVSPGNGLVSVEVGTLSLPGRGLDFAPTLVYSEPYAFRSDGSPYLYDNYTGASLGRGWALNFPWLGTNYLHLTDGQAFPYAWNGDTFQYNGVADFVLVANAGGGTYTLTMADGTVYQFNSAKQLTSVTDSTGNNTITFSYGANKYVSQVTDTIGRAIIFSYNSNDQLSSVSQGGRSWNLTYSGNRLASVVDPMGRVTSFQYAGASGADGWLLSAVVWPTGGKVAYAYSSAPVGTEVSAYYATLRDVYVSPTQLSLSQNVTYATVNGQVVWSNTTVSDGTTVREHLDYHFQPSRGTTTTYAYNGTDALEQVTQTDSDAAGGTSTTKLYSPAGTLLSQAVYAYDNWGNLVYSKDAAGQQEWFSYANTNSSGVFPAEGGIVPVTLTNSQGEATPSPFQQLIAFNPSAYAPLEAQNLGNIRFCADQSCSTPLPAWLESCSPACTPSASSANIWVKLHSSISAGGNATIYLEFLSNSTNFDGNYWGEAPQLSSGFGEYDNGANVFTDYTDFKGTSLPPGVASVVNGTASYAVNDGLTLTEGGDDSSVAVYFSSPVTYPQIVDTRMTSVTTGGGAKSGPFETTAVALGPGHLDGSYAIGAEGSASSATLNYYLSTASKFLLLSSASGSLPAVLGVGWDATGSERFYLNYAATSTTDSTLAIGNYYAGVYAVSRDAKSTGVYQWMRLRAYPPDGVMPAVKLGKLVIPNSCSTAGFYAAPVSSSIHDLLLGSCDYQNGPGSPQQEAFYDYSSSGNLLQEKTSHDGGWLYTDYTYDQYGNVLSTTNPDNVTIYSQYSPAYGSAYLTRAWTPDGGQNVTTAYSYDFATGDLLSQTDPNGYTTSYTYDALGRQTSVTYPAVDGVAATAYTYYYDGNNTMKTVDPDGHVTVACFDGLARETEVQQRNGSSVFSAVHYTYDWLDQVATKTTATGNTYHYGYDWAGRLVNLTNPDGTHELTSYNLTADTRTVTDELGHRTVYQYDRAQELTSVKEYNSSSTYYLTTYSYDLSGNMLSVTDARGQTTAYQYDDLNRLVKTTFPGGTAQAETYDSVGNLLARTTPNGSTMSYSYDALNRLTEVAYPGSGGDVTYTYDADGNRLSQVSPGAKDYYAYDARGRLTNQTEYVDGQKLQTLYAYDQAGNVVQITYPDGYALSMGYDGVGYLASVGRFANITYTPDGQISRIAYGNGEVQTYAYDSRDRPTQVKDVYGSTVEMDLNYTYDGTGNVLTENSQSYGYDALNRLTSASGPWGTISYAYDSVGNRVQMVNGSTVTDYAYGPFNRLLSAGDLNYTYDANGNMATKSGGWAYSYDYENRLTSVSHNGVVVQQDYYDGDGNRVEQAVGNSSIFYSYQGLNILYEKNMMAGSHTTVTKRFYAGGLQVAEMVNSTVYYLHQDALGSTVLETTSGVTVKFSSNYVPYGQNYQVSGKEEFMYAGRPYNSATGLYYEGARYYDPETGRFITEDSHNGTKTDPISQDKYIYGGDNPMRYVDPTGHSLVSVYGLYGGREEWNPTPSKSSSETTTRVSSGTTVTILPHRPWNGVDSYASMPMIGTESSTDQTQPDGNEAGAVLVVVLLGTSTVASGLATIVTSPLAITGVGAVVPFILGSTTFGLLTSTWDAGVYTATEGANATPEGAFASTPLDLFVQWLGDAISSLP